MSNSLYPYNLIGPQLPPYHDCTCAAWYCIFQKPFWHVGSLLMEACDYSIELSAPPSPPDGQVTDSSLRLRRVTQSRGQKVLPNYPARAALRLLARGDRAQSWPDVTPCLSVSACLAAWWSHCLDRMFIWKRRVFSLHFLSQRIAFKTRGQTLSSKTHQWNVKCDIWPKK